MKNATADGVTVSHSVTLIHIAHMMVIIHRNLRLYGFSSFIAEITFRWGTVNISQHAYISLVLPQYCRQVSPGPYANVSHFQFCCLQSQVLWHAFSVQPDSATTVNLFLGQVIKQFRRRKEIVHV